MDLLYYFSAVITYENSSASSYDSSGIPKRLRLVPTTTQSCGVRGDQSSVGSQAVVFGGLVAPVQCSPDDGQRT